MKAKSINGVDGREWSVGRVTEWGNPATGDAFEHDMGGRGSGAFLFGVAGFFWLVLVVWAPQGVFIPWFLWLAGLAVVAFFPLRWWLRRLVMITAETPGDKHLPAERWVGNVRGTKQAREEIRIITRRLRTQGTPGYPDSPLQPIN